ncbi:RsmD family RNA methyltransferase [bacterium]|nr:RsmD family RNA methyltransferase [bacterium]MBU1984167.1 RsmD family RNA methyltransferase [bacterium]
MAVRLSSGSHRHSRPAPLRPTAARTLEAVFDILAGEIEDRRVLDLFAGVGSYGIMALKQGAASATLVDKAHATVRRMLKAVQQFHLDERAFVYHEDVFHFLHRTGGNETFDLIFCDPPYEELAPAQVIGEIMAAGVLAHGGVLIFEHSRRQAPPDIPPLILRKSRVFGDTTISIWDRP